VWRVRSLHDLELHHAEQGVAERAPHVHGQFEIAVVERGAMRVVSGRSAEIAPAGSLLVIPPGHVHSHHSVAEHTSRRSFFPELASLVDAASSVKAGASPNFNTIVIDDADLARRIGALHRMLATPGSLLARETSAVAAATLLVERHAVGARSALVKRESCMVERVKHYLHDRLADNVSLGELAALTELPPYAIVRAFTREVGMPPHAYHLQLRIDRAKRLLAAGGVPARVANESGFVDQSHLTRHFRKWVGVTPGGYARAVIA
jgi:AraC-like DNA-binding protein